MSSNDDFATVSKPRRSLRVSRRTAGIMGVGIIAVIFGTGAAVMGAAATKLRPYRRLGERLLSVLGNGPALAAIGQTQLPGVSPLQQWEDLQAQFSQVESVEQWLERDAASLPSAVQHAARNDFKKGAIRPCSGWLLSKTEASLCASIALTTHRS